MDKKRVLSGMQPSGRMHLGNLLGALINWKKLQEGYDAFFFIADWHALSTNYSDTSNIRAFTREMLIDWLSVGIDTEKSTIFIQSQVPEHAILHVLLSMITPLPWLERNPTYKEQQQELSNRDLSTYGFLGYPVLQAADILIYKADLVPVGVDQLPHIELTREIARRFNFLYKEVFPVPEPLLTEVPKLIGIDGRKMSKSYGNAIYLSDTPKEVEEKVRMMITDPNKIRRGDPGNPGICTVFAFHKIFSSQEVAEKVDKTCRSGELGCVEDKKNMAKTLIKFLEPMWETRSKITASMAEEIGMEGSRKARAIALATLEEVKEAMKI